MVVLVLLALFALLAFGVAFTMHWLFVLAVIFALLWVISAFAGGIGDRRRSLWW